MRETVAYLLVIKTGRQREHASLRIQREHVVRPVADHRVGELGIRAQIRVRSLDLADPGSSGRIFRDVERVGVLRKRGRIVVRVGHLEQNVFTNQYLALN